MLQSRVGLLVMSAIAFAPASSFATSVTFTDSTFSSAN